MSPVEFFEANYIPEPNSGCWLWLGSVSPAGYGTMRNEAGKTTPAHRWSWQFANGRKIESRLIYVCHSCDNPPCVNPDHLWLGTSRDNMIDASRKGRLKFDKPLHPNRVKTHCPQGHEYTPENTHTGPQGRRCLTCRRQHATDYRRIAAIARASK